MKSRIVALAVMLLASLGAASGSRAQGLPACQLGAKVPVRSVAAHETEHTDLVEVTHHQLRGADLFVPAQPGLTKEWLQRVVVDQTAAGECDFGATAAKVSVFSASGGFLVRVTADDERSARAIIRHAKELVK